MAETTISKKVRNGMSQKLLAMVIIPMLLLAVAAITIGYNITLSSLVSSKNEELSSVAQLSANIIDERFPGDYSLQGDAAVKIYKGEEDITTRYDIVDTLYDQTGLDISLIYKDTRILTTICGNDRARIIGKGIQSNVLDTISTSEVGIFYSKTLINNEDYFSYYYPLYNSDDSFAGAIEVCSPYTTVTPLVWKSIIPIIVLIAIVTVILVVLIFSHNKSINSSIEKLLRFTQEAISGNDSVELDPSVTKRGDELGAIGSSVLEMHRSLRDMMDKDALTKLYNRRSANRKLELIRSHYTETASPYSVSIGDIDFFKKVNDTYGHDAGDMVLQAVAEVLNSNMKKYGFVARWGGEEFLLVFDKMNEFDAAKNLEAILDEIRALRIIHEDRTISITMSFGIACDPSLSQTDILKLADERLYFAKTNGRNQIINR